jgi:hypothetical protein
MIEHDRIHDTQMAVSREADAAGGGLDVQLKAIPVRAFSAWQAWRSLEKRSIRFAPATTGVQGVTPERRVSGTFFVAGWPIRSPQNACREERCLTPEFQLGLQTAGELREIPGGRPCACFHRTASLNSGLCPSGWPADMSCTLNGPYWSVTLRDSCAVQASFRASDTSMVIGGLAAFERCPVRPPCAAAGESTRSK